MTCDVRALIRLSTYVFYSCPIGFDSELKHLATYHLKKMT